MVLFHLIDSPTFADVTHIDACKWWKSRREYLVIVPNNIEIFYDDCWIFKVFIIVARSIIGQLLTGVQVSNYTRERLSFEKEWMKMTDHRPVIF